jgi:RNA polymerase sigma-70 factor, ECF subfamily
MTSMELELAIYPIASKSEGRGELDEIERIAAGDAAALGRAYDEHHGAVRAFCRRFLGDEAVAEDLVQDVFVALPGAVRRFRGDCSLRTFLVSMAVHQSRHHLRAATRRRRALGCLAEQPSPESTNPEQSAGRSELAQVLVRALDQIPHEQRVVFVLSDVEERPSSEVAAIMDIPEGTVRTRLFHARRKLRALMESQGVSS